MKYLKKSKYFPAVFPSGRAPQKEDKVPPKVVQPLVLRNKVKTQQKTDPEFACLPQMALTFSCLKANNFIEEVCSKEITNFYNCIAKFSDKAKEPRQKNYMEAVNVLLRKYPTQ